MNEEWKISILKQVEVGKPKEGSSFAEYLESVAAYGDIIEQNKIIIGEIQFSAPKIDMLAIDKFILSHKAPNLLIKTFLRQIAGNSEKILDYIAGVGDEIIPSDKLHPIQRMGLIYGGTSKTGDKMALDVVDMSLGDNYVNYNMGPLVKYNESAKFGPLDMSENGVSSVSIKRGHSTITEGKTVKHKWALPDSIEGPLKETIDGLTVRALYPRVKGRWRPFAGPKERLWAFTGREELKLGKGGVGGGWSEISADEINQYILKNLPTDLKTLTSYKTPGSYLNVACYNLFLARNKDIPEPEAYLKAYTGAAALSEKLYRPFGVICAEIEKYFNLNNYQIDIITAVKISIQNWIEKYSPYKINI